MESEPKTFAELDDTILIKIEALHARMLDPQVVSALPDDASASAASIGSAIELTNKLEQQYNTYLGTVKLLAQHGCNGAATRLRELVDEVRRLRAAYQQMQASAILRKTQAIYANMRAADLKAQADTQKQLDDLRDARLAAENAHVMGVVAQIHASMDKQIAAMQAANAPKK